MSVDKASPVINGSNFEAATKKCPSNGDGLANKSPEKAKMRCALSDRAARVLEIAIMTTVIIFVMALLSLPSMLHFATQVSVYILACRHNAVVLNGCAYFINV